MGQLVALFTFPGVIVHEIAHQFFCRRAGVAVLDACYFRIGNPSGYVVHGYPAKTATIILISIAPFLTNILVGALGVLCFNLKQCQ